MFEHRAGLETDLDDWQRILNINLSGSFIVARECARSMKAAGYGSVVLVSSQIGLIGHPQAAAYAASKSGVNGLMRALALEVKADGVRVHNICPGGVDTDFIKGTKLGERLADQTMIAPEGIAQMVVFFLKQPPNIDLPERVVRRFSK